MEWTETVRTAVAALNARRMRSLLTMLGILIGIAAVMLTVGLGQGAQQQITSQISALGSNMMAIPLMSAPAQAAWGRSESRSAAWLSCRHKAPRPSTKSAALPAQRSDASHTFPAAAPCPPRSRR